MPSPAKPLKLLRSPVTHRVALIHTADNQEAWDFCRGVASYRPHSGVWGLRSIPIESDAVPYLRRLAQISCDGVIMVPGHRETLDLLHRRGVKVVSVDGVAEVARRPYVRICLDNEHIGKLAGEHLLQRGFSRVIYLGDRSDWSCDRGNALHRVIQRGGGECQRVLAIHWGHLLSEEWIARQLKPMIRPFAVMGCDDMVAAKVVRVANANGWQIPTDIGVIGVDDRITECIGVQPPLSSISTERFGIGREAARLLDELFLGRPPAREAHRYCPRMVTERESTSVYVCEDADIAVAIAYIHREACNGISINELVRKVNLSRRTLERRFAQLVGRSPGDEIRRVRIEAVKRAIERGGRPLADIAAQCGYSCLSALSHSFRLATGMSPQQYRQNAIGVLPALEQ
jgi:LacI family transcriptional regulator